jgi:rhodanese-related sulfurtransferase
MNHIEYYKAKLAYETDAWDLGEALNAGENVVVIDVRTSNVYEEEHIPSAINIPHRTMTVETTAHLNLETRYVAYCDGIGCNGSTKGALKLAELGFQVKELLGGLDWWRRDGYETHGINATEGTAIDCGC